MTEEQTAHSSRKSAVPRVWTVEDYAVAATWLGLFLCLLGLADGIVMAAGRRVAACADGKYFPQGTSDFTCYAHPQAGLGIAIATFSVVLAILLVLARIVAVSVLQDHAARRESTIADQG